MDKITKSQKNSLYQYSHSRHLGHENLSEAKIFMFMALLTQKKNLNIQRNLYHYLGVNNKTYIIKVISFWRWIWIVHLMLQWVNSDSGLIILMTYKTKMNLLLLERVKPMTRNVININKFMIDGWWVIIYIFLSFSDGIAIDYKVLTNIRQYHDLFWGTL